MKRHITLCYMIDRTHSTDAEIDKFSRVAHHKVKPVDGVVKLNMFVDKSTLRYLSTGVNRFVRCSLSQPHNRHRQAYFHSQAKPN